MQVWQLVMQTKLQAFFEESNAYPGLQDSQNPLEQTSQLAIWQTQNPLTKVRVESQVSQAVVFEHFMQYVMLQVPLKQDCLSVVKLRPVEQVVHPAESQARQELPYLLAQVVQTDAPVSK